MADEDSAGVPEKGKRGRKSSFRPEFVQQAMKLCLLGATDADLADFFGVTEATINNWKKDHPEFFESLKRGKVQADAAVAKSLFRRAMGYSHRAVKIFNYEGEALVVPFVQHYPPDTAAAIFWLKNRQKDKWRDRIEPPDDSGESADPVTTVRFVKGKAPQS